MSMRVAVLGTGIMGHGMALTLLHTGFEVAVWNRTPEKARRLADDGARVAASVGEAVERAEVVLTMLYDGQAVLEVAEEFAGTFPSGAVWLQTSTVGTEWMARLAALARKENLPLVDAPVLGTKQPAEKGELTALVSGPADLIDHAGPVLAALSSKVVRAGGQLGAATSLKLACNAWLAAITAGLAQSLALAKGQGLDPELFLEAIDGTGLNMPYAKLKGAAMLAGDYPAAFTVENLGKDLDLIARAAASTGLDTGLLEALQSLFSAVSDAGLGGQDIAAVYTSFTR